MASIVAAVLKATLGLLIKKGRDLAADKLKEGDVTDEKFRNLIVREISDLKSKLDGLTRKNLLASIGFFKEGLVYVYQVLDSLKTSEKDGKLTAQQATGIEEESSLRSPTASLKTVCFAEEMRSLQPTDQTDSNTTALVDAKDKFKLPHGAMGTEGKCFRSPLVASVKTVCLTEEMRSFQPSGEDDSTTRALSDAKDRFKQAREKATEAFCNEALSTADRILAMQYRVMATILEKVDNPADALAACRLCLEELHSMPAVQKSFNVQLKQSFKSRFNKAEREEIISSVCRVNRVIYFVTQMVGWYVKFALWPCVDNKEEQINPLCDARLTELLREYHMEHPLSKSWSLIYESEDRRSDNMHCCITANSLEQFVIADVDSAGPHLKVFDSSGEHVYCCRLQLPLNEMSGFLKCSISDIAIDRDNRVFLLMSWQNVNANDNDGQKDWSTVYLFDEHANLQHEFNLKQGPRGALITVSDNNKVFVAVGICTSRALKVKEVQVYNTNGMFFSSFGMETLKKAWDMTATNSVDCKILVLDVNSTVHLFNELGDYLSQFKRNELKLCCYGSLAFDRVSEHAVVLLNEYDVDLNCYYPRVLQVFTKNGVFVCNIHLPTEWLKNHYKDLLETKVTNEGLVVMWAVDKKISKRKIVVLQY